MNELNNSVTAAGTYNSIPTSLTSNTMVVNMIEGLTIVKDADKKNWADGALTYTVTIQNNTDKTYENPIVTDVIDNKYVDFIEGSVMIGSAKATETQASYDDANHTLTVKLNNVLPSTSSIFTFQVQKKS